MIPMEQFTIFKIYYTYFYRILKNIAFVFAFFILKKARALGIFLVMGTKVLSRYEAIFRIVKVCLTNDQQQITKKITVLKSDFLNNPLVSMFSLSVPKLRDNSGAEGPIQFGKLTLKFLKAASKWPWPEIPARYFLLIFCLSILGSVQAQTNVKNNKTDTIAPLMIGASVPDDFWTKKHLFYLNGDTVVRTLEEYKGKLLILDFWATWCGQCWSQMPMNEQLVSSYKGEVKMLLIDTKNTGDNFENIAKTDKTYLKRMGVESLETIFKDEYFASLFPVRGYPKYMWISPSGYFIAASTRNSVVKGHIDGLLEVYKSEK